MRELTFYFDLGSPYAYLAAARLPQLTSEPVRWQPILLGGLFGLTGRSSWAQAGAEPRTTGMAEIERRAQEYGMAPIRWPDPWPASYLFAMRATTHAFAAGRGREFTMQAYEDAFVRGHDLGDPQRVLDAAQSVGLERAGVEAAVNDPAVKLALREATDAAHVAGVIGVPTLVVDGEPFWGDDRLADALGDRLSGRPR
jgi:2-hydroxychromene-2-carboxylate isomerase